MRAARSHTTEMIYESPKAPSYKTNPVLDQLLEPEMHVGLLDRETCSALRTQITETDLTVTAAATDVSIVLRSDSSRYLGVYQSGVTDTTQHQYSGHANFNPGVDPINGTSICRVAGNIDVAKIPYVNKYGAGSTSTTGTSFLRFLGTADATNQGFPSLADENGGILPSDGYGFIKLPDSLVAAGGTIPVRWNSYWDVAGSAPDTYREQIAIYQYPQPDPSLAGTSCGSATSNSTQIATIAFTATLVPGNGSYIRVRLQCDGTSSAGITRNLESAACQFTWTGDDALNYEYSPLPGAAVLSAQSAGYRFVANHLWGQYRSNDLVKAGNVAATQMSLREFQSLGRPWLVSDISRINGFYEGQVEKGFYGIWSPKGEDDYKFKQWDYHPSDTTVLVVAVSGLAVGEVFRLMTRTCIEIETRDLNAGPQRRLVDERFMEQAIDVLGSRPQWFTENPFHDRVISGLKAAGKWVVDNKTGIVKFIKGVGEVAASVGKIAMMVAPLVV